MPHTSSRWASASRSKAQLRSLIQALIRSQHPVNMNRLIDPDVSLEDLAGEDSSGDQ
jgi:hypothetical protein